MPFLYYANAHYENRAEDLCQLPLIYLIYLLSLALDRRAITRIQYVLAGVALGTMIFVKWNFPIMLAPLLAATLFLEYRNGKSSVQLIDNNRVSTSGGVIYTLLGIVGIAVIVATWMSAQGAIQAMIFEYFHSTAGTIHFDAPIYFIKQYIFRLLIHVPTAQTWTLVFFFCTLMAGWRRFGRKGLLPGICYACIIAFICLVPDHAYYEQIGNSFGIFIPILVILLLKNMYSPSIRVLPILMLATLISLFWPLSFHENSRFRKCEYGYGETYFKMQERTSQLVQPKILYLGSDYGLGIKSSALPASRYWSQQWYALPHMVKSQREAMHTTNADIVVTGLTDSLPLQYGYHSNDDDIFVSPYPSGGNLRVWWSPRIQTVYPQ